MNNGIDSDMEGVGPDREAAGQRSRQRLGREQHDVESEGDGDGHE
jgi:hypothetical protein